MGTDLRVEGISYLVCATQRSGSTLLCELLRATDVAGVPDEYFERLRGTGLARQPRQYFEEPSVRGHCRATDADAAGTTRSNQGNSSSGSATCSSGGPRSTVSSAPR